MKKLIFILTMLMNIPANALIRGNDIYPACAHIKDHVGQNDLKNKDDAIKIAMLHGVRIGYCMGVIGTAFQAIRGVGYIWSVDKNFSTCMEKYYGLADIDGHQILDMMMKYLKNHPEHRDIEVNIIMASMLHDYYPESVCLKKKK